LSGRKQLHCRADQCRQIVGVKLVLELRADIDDRLVTDIEFFSDAAVGFAIR
jgi:hypothetical protein